LCDNSRKTIYLRKKSKKLGKNPRHYTLEAQQDIKNGLKYCPGCKTKKIISSYYTNKASASGVDFYCIKCKKTQADINYDPKKRARYYKNLNKEELKNKQLQRKFGISLEYYNQMLVEQNYKCDCCKKNVKDNKKLLAVDHCHKTNKIRGLLCNNCNAALGFIKEDIEIAQNLINYIIKYSKES
jgi:hypothetical protein